MGFDEADGLMDEFAGSGVVGDGEVAGENFGEGAADDFDAEGLGSLHRPEARAVDVSSDVVVGGSFLDGVSDFLGGDGGSGFGGGGERVADDFFGGAGARAVLDGDNRGVRRKSCEAVPD